MKHDVTLVCFRLLDVWAAKVGVDIVGQIRDDPK